MNQGGPMQAGDPPGREPRRGSRLLWAAVIIVALALGGGHLAVRMMTSRRVERAFRERFAALAKEPDGFCQLCINNYHLVSTGIYRDMQAFTPATYVWLRANRGLAVKALEEELERAVDARMGGFREPPVEFGSHLAFIVDLNAQETLPKLVEIEKRVRAKFQIRPPTENAPINSRIEFEGRTDGDAFYQGCAYAQLNSAILVILRQERFGPALGPEIDQAQSWEERSYVRVSSLTAERRDMIVGWAERFLSEVPPEKRLGPGGMIPEPIER